MPWSVTLGIMLPPRGSNDFTSEYVHQGEQRSAASLTARERRGAYRIGSVESIRPYFVPQTVALPRTGFVHITGIPDTVRPARLAQALMEVWPGLAEGMVVERRKWGVDLSSIPLAMRRQLRDNRQVEITWTQAKAFYRRLTDGHAPVDEDFA